MRKCPILKILGCSVWKDISAVQLSWRSVKPCRSYCPFNVVFSYFSTLTFNISESIIAREIILSGTCCIDWLIDCCLFTPYQQLRSFHGGKKYKQYISILKRKISGVGWATRKTVLECHWKKGVMGRDWNLAFVAAPNAPALFRKTTRGIFYVREVWHSSNTVPTMVRAWAFRIMTQVPPGLSPPRAFPYPPPGDAPGCSVGRAVYHR